MQVSVCGTAVSSDQFCPEISDFSSIIGHDMLGAGIADFTFLKNRNPAVSFGDQILSSGIFHFTNRLK